MEHVMVDLETLGTVPGCSILSIGAVFFDPLTEKLGDEMYAVILRQSCLEAGLHEDKDTLAWWSRQSPEAKRVLAEAEMETVAYPLLKGLEEFNTFCKLGKKTKVWGNGADFDNPILVAAYHAVGSKQGWAPYNGRCYRTVKNLFPQQKLVGRTGTHHNALDDAKSQAAHLIQLVQMNGITLS